MIIKVLDHGYVQLIESWGSEERIIEAARMSTDKGFNGWGDAANPGDEKLLAHLYNHKHATPFEMAGLIIEVKAPIFVVREWHRHRTQGYNEMSARYVPLPNENYRPSVEEIVARSQAGVANKNRQAQGSKACTREEANQFLYRLDQLYWMAQSVYEEGLRLGVPKELSRLPVPVGRYTRMRATANLRNWLGFLTLRMAPDAQKEIREYAKAVGQIVAKHFPRTWNLFIGSVEQERKAA